MPKAPDVVALVKDYKGDAAKDAGEAFDATPANIEARTMRSKLPGGLAARAAAEEDARRRGVRRRCRFASAMRPASRTSATRPA